MLHGGDKIDQKSHFAKKAKCSDKDPEMHQSDSNATKHRLPQSRHDETAQHAEHQVQAPSKLKRPTRHAAAELHDLHTDEDQQSEQSQRGQDGR